MLLLSYTLSLQAFWRIGRANFNCNQKPTKGKSWRLIEMGEAKKINFILGQLWFDGLRKWIEERKERKDWREDTLMGWARWNKWNKDKEELESRGKKRMGATGRDRDARMKGREMKWEVEAQVTRGGGANPLLHSSTLFLPFYIMFLSTPFLLVFLTWEVTKSLLLLWMIGL